MSKPFRVLGIQQIAIGGPDKARLRSLWVDIFGLAVKPGQAVQAGERLAVIEAMKMENILTAAQDGTDRKSVV